MATIVGLVFDDEEVKKDTKKANAKNKGKSKVDDLYPDAGAPEQPVAPEAPEQPKVNDAPDAKDAENGEDKKDADNGEGGQDAENKNDKKDAPTAE